MMIPLLTIYLIYADPARVAKYPSEIDAELRATHCAQLCICRPTLHHWYSVYEGQREPERWWWTLPLRHHREKK